MLLACSGGGWRPYSPHPNKFMSDSILTLGLPSGSLMEATLTLFKRAGFSISGANRSYRPVVDDPELRLNLLRAQEMSRYVEGGFLDCGITGRDWVQENGSEVEVLAELPYSKATANPTRWVVAVPEDSPYRSVKDLEGKRIATEAVGLTRRYFESKGVKAEIEFSWGATEVKVPDLVDAIVDITETGSSLRANNLRILETSSSRIRCSSRARTPLPIHGNAGRWIASPCCWWGRSRHVTRSDSS